MKDWFLYKGELSYNLYCIVVNFVFTFQQYYAKYVLVHICYADEVATTVADEATAAASVTGSSCALLVTSILFAVHQLLA